MFSVVTNIPGLGYMQAACCEENENALEETLCPLPIKTCQGCQTANVHSMLILTFSPPISITKALKT